jgi:hypothetical protein
MGIKRVAQQNHVSGAVFHYHNAAPDGNGVRHKFP